ETMRESFEEWFSDDWRHPSAVGRDAVGYKLAETQNAWTVWQAAWQAALAALMGSDWVQRQLDYTSTRKPQPRGININGHTYVRRSATSYVCRRCGHDMCREGPKPCSQPEKET